jgi:hypothetical protein
LKATESLVVPSDIIFGSDSPRKGYIQISRISPNKLQVKNSFDNDECLVEIDGVIIHPADIAVLDDTTIGSFIIEGRRVRQFLIDSSDFN